jgi:uncharacterized protein (TIGR03435 family)
MRFAYVSVVALLTGSAFAQSAEIKPATEPGPTFEIADVHVTPRSNSIFNQFRTGPFARGGRYEVRSATMVDLISVAYGVDPDKVLGGPTWLEMDRFDVIGKLPAGSTPESQKAMLQSLLAARFKLVAHNDSKPMPAYLLTAGKRPLLKPADGSSSQKGCQGQPRPQNAEAGTIPYILVSCHDMTMAAFAESVHQMAGGYLRNPVVDSTGLKGSWDFDIKWTGRGQLAAAGADGISIFDAVEKQLGLKLDLSTVPLPVVVVESVNEKPTDNSPDVAKNLPGSVAPTEFEVADIKPTPADFQGARFNVQPGGRVTLQGVTLRLIIQQVWNVSDEMLINAPKWLGTDRFDIIAKAPNSAMTGGGPNSPPIDIEAVFTMMKSLLAERFKMATHMEERPVPAYTLLAAKPKMKPADPSGRTKCMEGPGADGKDPRDSNPVLGRLITCQNMTMTKLADLLQGLAPGYIHAPVLDATGLKGAWDFTLSFSPAGAGEGGGGRGGRGGDGAAAGGTADASAASDPSGAVSLLDALPKQLGLKLEMQKRPIQVLVIDHIEQKPTDN